MVFLGVQSENDCQTTWQCVCALMNGILHTSILCCLFNSKIFENWPQCLQQIRHVCRGLMLISTWLNMSPASCRPDKVVSTSPAFAQYRQSGPIVKSSSIIKTVKANANSALIADKNKFMIFSLNPQVYNDLKLYGEKNDLKRILCACDNRAMFVLFKTTLIVLQDTPYDKLMCFKSFEGWKD